MPTYPSTREIVKMHKPPLSGSTLRQEQNCEDIHRLGRKPAPGDRPLAVVPCRAEDGVREREAERLSQSTAVVGFFQAIGPGYNEAILAMHSRTPSHGARAVFWASWSLELLATIRKLTLRLKP